MLVTLPLALPPCACGLAPSLRLRRCAMAVPEQAHVAPTGGGASELAASSPGGGLDPSLTCCIIPGGGSSPPTDMQHHP